MTHTRQYADSDGTFGEWKPTGQRCDRRCDSPSPAPDQPFAEFLKQLSAVALAALRHEAIRDRDDESKRVIDEEFKRRERVPVSGLPCGHPVEVRVWESHDGAFEDYQHRCVGGGHVWWIDGIDS